jgi:hypothetical protein
MHRHGRGWMRHGQEDLRPKSREWWVHKGRQEQIMQEYGGGGDACTVDDYQELVIQFCFVTLFGAAFPVLALGPSPPGPLPLLLSSTPAATLSLQSPLPAAPDSLSLRLPSSCPTPS